MRTFLRWLPHAILLVLTGLIFLRVLDADFVVWDDLALIINNPLVNGFHPSIFWVFEPELYTPLALLTFQFEHWLTGFEPTLFHATNLFIHLVNVYLVWKLLNTFGNTEHACLPDRQGTRNNISALVFATALFALHPVQVETVAWVSARKELLWTLFGLLALLNHLRDAEQLPKSLDQYLPQKYQTFLLILLALLSKPTAVILPLLIILLDTRKESLRSVIIRHRMLLVVAVAIGALALLGKSETDLMLNFGQRLALLGMGFFFSLRLVLWPVGLAALHPATTPVSLLSMPYAVAFIMLIAMVACFWRLHRRAGKVNIAAALFMLALLPGLLSPVHAQTITVMSEHYLYFPMIGIALLAFLSMEKIAPKIQSSKSRILGLVGLFGILAFLSLSTFKQTDMWQDSATLFTSVRKVYPRSVAVLTNLGTAYAQIGMYGEAESVLRQAIGIDPEATQARFNYAGLRYVKGNYAGAIEEYKRVLESVPLDQDALRMLTWSYFRIGDIRNAEETYDTVIHLNPTLRSQLPRLDDPPPEQGDM